MCPPDLWALEFTVGQKTAFLCQGYKSLMGRGGEEPCLDPARNAGHGHPLFVLLGLCRICGIVLREALARTCSAALGGPSLQAGRFH